MFTRRPLLAVLVALLAPVATAAAQHRTVLAGATLIDGSGAPPVMHARVVMVDGRFACISGPDGCPPLAGDSVVDLAGRWIIPGLIDTHVHLMYDSESPASLDRAQRLRFALGITTTRDAGSQSLRTLLAKRDTAADPARAVPRLVIAARTTDAAAAEYRAERGALLVEELVRRGVDAIKLKQPFDGRHWRVEIRAARALGVPVFGHTWGDPDQGPFTLDAIAEGVSGVSHLIGVVMGMQPPGVDMVRDDSSETAGWRWLRDLWTTVDTAAMDSLIDAMARGQVWLEPMLAHEYYWGRAIAPPASAPFLGPPPRLRDALPWFARSAAALEPRYPETWQRQAAFVRRFVERGGIVITGSDGVDPGLDLHEEMRLIGLATGNPMRGLLAATRDAATALARPEIGTVAAGMVADAVILTADPLSHGGSTAIVQVIKAGVPHDEAGLMQEFREEHRRATQSLWLRRAVRYLLPTLLIAAAVTWFMLRRRRRG